VDYVVRDYRASDREQVVSLLERGLFIQGADERIQKVYDENPAGPAMVVVAEATEAQRIIGSYTLFPFRLLLEGEPTLVVQRGDLIVDPEYRGGGVFRAMRDYAEGMAIQKGMPFLFGMPNPAALVRHRKMGCVEVGDMRTVFLPLDVSAVLRRRLRHLPFASTLAPIGGTIGALAWHESSYRDTGEYECRVVANFDSTYDEFWGGNAPVREIMIVRDGAYLRWRLAVLGVQGAAYGAEKDGRVVGYILLRQRNDGLLEVRDLLTAGDEKIASLLIHTAVGCARQRGLVGLTFQALEDNPYFPAFRRCGFRHIPSERVSALVLAPAAIQDPPQSWADSGRWFLTTGDRE